MREVRQLGVAEVLERAVRIIGGGPVFLTVDVDVLDPAVAPGTRRAGAGWYERERPALRLSRGGGAALGVGADLVEVIPAALEDADITALIADRLVREIVTGVALRGRALA